MKIVSIVGARPQFVKLGPLSRELRKKYDEIIVHTGQHFDPEMSRYFFQDLEIPEPDFNLNISGGNHGEQTGKMLIDLEKILLKEKPALVIVFGDTNSTLAGSLVAVKMGIKVIHIEAGLRSFNRKMPEEINRIISDHTSDYLFAPTDNAIKNLNIEGLSEKSYLTGDIMVDALQFGLLKGAQVPGTQATDGLKKEFYLLTLHRPYNVDDPEKLANILVRISELDENVIFPVHPRTKNIILKFKFKLSPRISIVDPVGYIDFLVLEQNSKKIITDSGGIQKEAYILKKPCITLRTETEWIETIESGWNILLDVHNKSFVDIIHKFTPVGEQKNIFGDKVAEKMINIIQKII
jgi:UDP-N-acetylglucosamine 2-epimerase